MSDRTEGGQSPNERMERMRVAKDLYQELTHMNKEDLTSEERAVLQSCADDIGKYTTLGSIGGFGFTYFLGRLGGLPLLPKIFFNVTGFFFGGYLGLNAGSGRCSQRFMTLGNSSKLGELARLTSTNIPIEEIMNHEESGFDQPRQEQQPRRKRGTRPVETVERHEQAEFAQPLSSEMMINEDQPKKTRRNQYGDIVED